MNKLGKIGRLNQKEARELRKLWLAKDIRWCEYPYPHDCNFGMFSTNAHKMKKRHYRGLEPQERWSYKQVIRICQNSHNLIEYNKELSNRVFEELRGN